jgi:hypothetical protein
LLPRRLKDLKGDLMPNENRNVPAQPGRDREDDERVRGIADDETFEDTEDLEDEEDEDEDENEGTF